MFPVPWRCLLIVLLSTLIPLQVAYSWTENDEGYFGLPIELITDANQFQSTEILVKLKDAGESDVVDVLTSKAWPQKTLSGNSGSMSAFKVAGVMESRPLHRSTKKAINLLPDANQKNEEDPRGARRWYRLTLESSANPVEIFKQLQQKPQVEHVEFNHQITLFSTPNDPDFSTLWGLHNIGQTNGLNDSDIDATEAWDIQQGSESVLIAVIDTGVDYAHQDLAENIWVNPGEIPGNGIDDDVNGFVDDVHGYDFANDDNDPFDDNGHGTHVSGIIAAVGNNGIGVTGVNWHAQIMALKFLDAAGNGNISDAAEAIIYAADMGVRIMNNSWGGTTPSRAIEDAIVYAEAADVLIVAAAGNTAGNNNDIIPNYPASYEFPNIIAVAATDHNDELAPFSCFGVNSVDICAPGVNILSTTPGNTYSAFDGTSMATSHVTGAAGLLLAQHGSLSALQMRTHLLNYGGDSRSALEGIVATGKRLNINNALACDDNTPRFFFLEPTDNFRVGYDAVAEITFPVQVSGSVYSCEGPVTEATVTISFDNGTTTLSLFDDGLHGDGSADDGVYGNIWAPQMLGQVTLSASGETFASVNMSGTVFDTVDKDDDGLGNAFELDIGTDPLNSDTDGDTLSDGVEVCYDGDCLAYTPGADLNPFDIDTDHDSHDDSLEFDYAGDGLDPLVSPWRDIEVASLVGSAASCAAVLGDINGDTISDFAASITTGAGEAGGSLQVFSGRSQSLLFTIAAPADVAWFGYSCSNAGDMNGDGVHDIVVSSGFEEISKTYSVMIFSGTDGSPINRWNVSVISSKISIDNLKPEVVGGMDFDGDLIPDVVVGNWVMNRVVIQSGLNGALIASFQAPNNYTGFGRRIAIGGDIDGGGLPDIVIGQPYAPGYTYVFSAETGQEIVKYIGEIQLDQIGQDVDGIGDVNGDGIPDFLTGGIGVYPFVGISDSPAVVVSGADGTPIFQWRGQVGGLFGSEISKFNIDGDSFPDILVGAPFGYRYDDHDWINEGCNGELYVYNGADGSESLRFHTRGSGAYNSGNDIIRNLTSMGDINGDDKDDILFTRTNAGVHVLLSPGLPAPEIFSFSPDSGVGIGERAVIQGENFCSKICGQQISEYPNINMTINGKEVTSALVDSTEILFDVPAGATTGPLSLITLGGIATTTEDFIVRQAPEISFFTPTGCAVIGDEINIQGSDLMDAIVTINGVEVDEIFASNTYISFYLPEGATTGPMTVTTAYGTVSGEMDLIICPPPQITSFTPESGIAVGGEATIIGEYFCQNNCGLQISSYPDISMSINETEITMASVNPTEIIFTVPEGATTGPITLTTPGGTTTSEDFIVFPTPKIISLAPESGVGVGGKGSISGENFCQVDCGQQISEYPDVSLTINGTEVTWGYVLPTVVLFDVPEGATTGPIVLTTPGGTANGPEDFIVTP